MKTYQSLRAQIDKLEKQAQSLRQAEIGKVVAALKKTIAEYALTAADLGLDGSKARQAPRRGTRATVGVAKYRDPASGHTWTGRGRPPAWILGAQNRDDFLIAGAGANKRAAVSNGRAGAASRSAKKPRGRKAAAA